MGSKTENRKERKSEKRELEKKRKKFANKMVIHRKPVQKRGISENAVFPLLAFKRVKRIHLEKGQSKTVRIKRVKAGFDSLGFTWHI